MTLAGSLDFVPVPLKLRHDGWTPDLQATFIAALANGAGVSAAARAVGKSRTTAYALRRKAGAEDFAAAWDAGLARSRRARPIVVRTVRTPAPIARSEKLVPLDGRQPLSADRLFAHFDGHAPESDDANKADSICATS